MKNDELERLKEIRTFPSLVKYLKTELDWPITTDDIDEITYDYEAEELGLDEEHSVKIKSIKQLRPLTSKQPWGIFYVEFEPKNLSVVVLRRILRSLVVKRRYSKNRLPTWQLNDLLFISSYGIKSERALSFAYFSDNSEWGDLPTLMVLGWDDRDTVLHLQHAHNTLKEYLHWPEDENNLDAWRTGWSTAFTIRHKEVINTSKELASRLAVLAKKIRNRVNSVMRIESPKGPIRKLYFAFKETLVHDLSQDDFADMYAQTIAYGLLTARVSRPEGIVADNLSDMMPITNPFLKELLSTFLTIGGRKSEIDFDELGINEIVKVLRKANMEAVLRDFGDRNPDEDPVIHFYELFLKEYDPVKRMNKGVFYTPKPVVSFIVKSIHESLINDFNIKDGLADTITWGEFKKNNPDVKIPSNVKTTDYFVKILDPATGTGTFLVEVIDLIHKHMTNKWINDGYNELEIKTLWNEYVSKRLLTRLYGFELMMAPYAIAHMKIGLKLAETGYKFLIDERARIFLTNSLEEPQDFSNYFEQMAPALAHEGKAANVVKKEIVMTVILGNPPYSGISTNKGEWITQQIENYKYVDGEHFKERKHWLQDDYVKFIRFAQWKIDHFGEGILAFITNRNYLDNTTFRGMRQNLMNTFDKVCILDLHGDSVNVEKKIKAMNDENVFDIQQGVAISFLIKYYRYESKSFNHSDLYGLRDYKYNYLTKNTIGKIQWKKIEPDSPYYFFIKRDELNREKYNSYKPVTEFFPINVSGILTSRDEFVTDFNIKPLKNRISEFRALQTKDESIRLKYALKDTRGWKLKDARKALSKDENWSECFTRILWKPFDIRFIYYHQKMVDWGRPEVMRHMMKDNIALVVSRQTQSEFRHAFISNLICPFNLTGTAGRYGSGYLFPLFLYPEINKKDLFSEQKSDEKKPNIEPKVFEFLKFKYKKEVNPEEIFYYIYAVLYSNTYRTKYTEFLKIDFPRIPFTSNNELFIQLGKLGKQIAGLHLLKSDELNKPISKFSGAGNNQITKRPEYEDERVYINNTQYFTNVKEEVWTYQIGGYQVCEKWLKDRKDRELSPEEIQIYCKIVTAIDKTILIQREIDELYDNVEEDLIDFSQLKTG
jgi:predicted helicase